METRLYFMKTILLIATMLFAHGAVASDNKFFSHDCGDLINLVGIDQLAKFKRVNGVYRIDTKSLKWLNMAKYGWPGVFIPPYNYGDAELFEKPFKGVAFEDQAIGISVRVYRIQQTIRRSLYAVTKPNGRAIFNENYKNKSMFSFLDDNLGVVVDGFSCSETNLNRAFSMIMSAVVLPENAGLTHVYRLTNPEALLLVSAVGEPTSLTLIFPNSADIDTLDYVSIGAGERYIADIVQKVVRINLKPKQK